MLRHFSRHTVLLLALVCINLPLVGCGTPTQPGAVTRGVAETTSSVELAKTLDLSKLPAPPNTEFNTQTAAEVQALVPLAIQPAADFYLNEFAKLGYTPSGEPGSHIVNTEYAQASLAKDGHTVSLSVIPGQDGKVMVSIHRHGNLDARTLPKSEGAESSFASSTLHSYVAQGTVADEIKFLKKSLTKAGWQSFGLPNSASAEDPNHQTFSFRKQGYVVSGSVSVAPAQQNKTMVQYQVRTLSHELPAPSDAMNVQYDDHRVQLICDVPGDIATVAKFYEKEMPTTGYIALRHDDPHEKTRSLRYETPSKGIVLVQLKSEDQKTTHVEFLYYPPSVVAKIREQQDPPAEAPDRNTPPPKTEDKIMAQDVPLPPPLPEDIRYDAARQQMSYVTGESIPDAVAELQACLIGGGWKEQPASTVAQANIGSLLFFLGNASLNVTLVRNNQDQTTEVSIQTTGLGWE